MTVLPEPSPAKSNCSIKHGFALAHFVRSLEMNFGSRWELWLEEHWSTWDGQPVNDDADYAVLVYRKLADG